MRNEPESKLLRRKEESLVRRDVLVHEPRVLEAVRQASADLSRLTVLPRPCGRSPRSSSTGTATSS